MELLTLEREEINYKKDKIEKKEIKYKGATKRYKDKRKDKNKKCVNETSDFFSSFIGSF